jgi:hypothetical protein
MLLSRLLVLKIETDHEMAYLYATRLDMAREGGEGCSPAIGRHGLSFIS